VRTFADLELEIPLFLSSYGNNASRPRPFQETIALYEAEMMSIFSGGCQYEFYEMSNRYGLVWQSEDGQAVNKLEDFHNLKEQTFKVDMAQRTSESSPENTARGVESPRPFPAVDANWKASPHIPDSPVN
jgi:hypothetical protein